MKKARVSHFNTPAAHDLPNFLVLDSDFNMEHFLEYDDLFFKLKIKYLIDK